MYRSDLGGDSEVPKSPVRQPGTSWECIRTSNSLPYRARQATRVSAWSYLPRSSPRPGSFCFAKRPRNHVPLVMDKQFNCTWNIFSPGQLCNSVKLGCRGSRFFRHISKIALGFYKLKTCTNSCVCNEKDSSL